MKTDVQIAQEAKMKPIKEVADYLGFPEEAIESPFIISTPSLKFVVAAGS